MYAVQGRTWVALGDPVGPREAAETLVRDFLEHVDDYQGIPVFYEATREWLHRYADFGLTFAKLGEDARVFAAGFLPRRRRHEQEAPHDRAAGGEGRLQLPGRTRRKRSRRGCSRNCGTCRTTGSPTSTPRRRGSRSASSTRPTSRAFPSRSSSARDASRPSRISGRAAARIELSMDLMRYRTSAPPGVMDALLVEVMQWGRDEGYQWFSLGMAPLVGPRGVAGRAALVEARAIRLRLRRDVLQLQGPARLQGEVRPGVGAALSRLSRRARAAARPRRRLGAHRGGLQRGSS